jgi:hypothetical protein
MSSLLSAYPALDAEDGREDHLNPQKSAIWNAKGKTLHDKNVMQ